MAADLPRRVISGAQTGADRAALDVALELGIESGGWVPRGRLDENGRIPDRYTGLRETASAEWNQRTEANVREGDGTLILSRGPLTGGSLFTEETAKRLRRPCLHLDLDRSPPADAASVAREWIEQYEIAVLNVAGPRASKDPEIHALASRVLRLLLR